MKKSNVLSLTLLIAAFALAWLPADPASGQIFASDNATNYNPGSTWTNESNQGFGFQPWLIVNNGGTVSGGFAGTYIGSSGTAIDTSGDSFGLYANGTGYNYSIVYRAFTNSLTTNDVFKVSYANGFLAGDAIDGFSLRSDTSTNSTTESSLVQGGDGQTRFSFYFVGSLNDYYIYDGQGFSFDTGIGYSSTGLSLEFTVLPGDTYRFVIKSGDGSTTLTNFSGFPLAGTAGAGITNFAGYQLQNEQNQNVFFNSLQISSTSLVPPTIVNVQPTNNSIYLNPTNNVSFEVDSVFSTISSANVKLLLNGVSQTGLVFGGTPTALTATNTTPLATNAVYNASIIATDSHGNSVTNNFMFNTWSTNLTWIEANDYNFNSGIYLASPTSDEYGNPTGIVSGSISLAVSNGIDVFNPAPPTPNASSPTNAYRPQDLPYVDLDTPCSVPGSSSPSCVTPDVDHDGFAAGGYFDFDVSYEQPGEWLNYTRSLSNTTYNVYARMASLSANPTMEFDHLANSTATTTNQPYAALGTMVCPANTGGDQNYVFVPLTDFFSHPVELHFGGTVTYRTVSIGGAYNFYYLLLVPNTNTATLRPYISLGFPYPGVQDIDPDTIINFSIANRTTTVTPASIQLFLNSNNVTSGITLSNNTAGTMVTYAPPTFLTPNSTNTLTAIFEDSGSVLQTNTWTFTVANTTIVSLPSAYAEPVGTYTNRGFLIDIFKAYNSASPTNFPTNAGAEALLAGAMLDPATGLPFTNTAAGPNGNGIYIETNVINFDITGTNNGGTFPDPSPFPYVPAGPTNNYIAMEALGYLQLAVGDYTFVVRSDDGFQFSSGMTPTETNTILGLFDGGRGNGTPSVFDFSVSTAGLYPVRLLYYQGTAAGNVELYSFDRSKNNAPVLINDPANPDAILAFQATTGPLAVDITGTTRSAAHTISFSFLTESGHTHTVEYANTLPKTPSPSAWTTLMVIAGNGSETNVVDTTATTTSRYYRIVTQ